jgi:hypothetical protein
LIITGKLILWASASIAVSRWSAHAGGLHDLLGAGLVAHRLDGFRRRPDEHQTRIAAGLGKILILGEKAIARVNRIRAARFSRRDDRANVEVGLRRPRLADPDGSVGLAHMQRIPVSIGIYRDHTIAEPARGAHDP